MHTIASRTPALGGAQHSIPCVELNQLQVPTGLLTVMHYSTSTIPALLSCTEAAQQCCVSCVGRPHEPLAALSMAWASAGRGLANVNFALVTVWLQAEGIIAAKQLRYVRVRHPAYAVWLPKGP